MRQLLTPEEMGAADTATIDAGTPQAVLMERAGRAVARSVIRLLGGRYGRRVVVVCGKGNNGGDGLIAARVLEAEGVAARAVRVEDLDPTELERADVVVDAIFGTGFRGQAEGDAAAAIAAVNASGAIVVSVDIPSGVHGETGRVEGSAVQADVTVVMAAQKIGTAVGQGAAHAGDIEVVDIGISVPDAKAWMPSDFDVSSILPRKEVDAHKRSAGSVALLCGSEGMSGAAILATRGAVRMGAGYATLGCTPGVQPIVAAKLPEVLTSVVAEESSLGPESLDAFKPVLERADALVVGPGLGQDDRQRKLVHRILDEVSLPVVLDADGLNVLAGDASALETRDTPAVITPHPAELARLLQTETSTVQADRVAAARSAAARFGCVVVLKGFRSIVARPDGEIVVIPTGTQHLATAGTGDVLAGAVGAFLAAGLDPFEAAWAAAYVHGEAGEIAAIYHHDGVLAWDVAEALPDAVAALGGEA